MINRLSNWREIIGRLAAELTVVVLGVTIALWADGWVAERQDRAVELSRLAALQENIRSTLTQLRVARNNATGAAAALRNIVSLQQRDSPYKELEEPLQYGLLYGPDFYPELNVYDDLKHSGELALLTNPELRQTLATMDARLELLEFARSDFTTVQQLNIDSYMIDHLDLRSFFEPSNEVDDIDDSSQQNLQFMSDMKFRNLVLFKLDLVIQLERNLENVETALVAVEQSVASQLAPNSH